MEPVNNMTDKGTDKEQATFDTVLAQELDLIQQTRVRESSESPQNSTKTDNKNPSVYTRACDACLAGLAFSGGGIRSATLNLGIIQALANLRLLSKFDYLSTVSGGGYIGGWLSSLLHRHARGKIVNEEYVEDIQRYLQPHPTLYAAHTFQPTIGFPPVEHKAVRYLRRYSNYLSPKLGLSGDLLAVIAIFLRNFILIQLALISLVAFLVLAAHGVGIASDAPDMASPQGMRIAFLTSIWPFVTALLALGAATWFTGRLLASQEVKHEDPFAISRAVHLRIIFPCLLSAWLFSAAVANQPDIVATHPNALYQAGLWMLVTSAVYAGGWGLGRIAASPNDKTTTSEFKQLEIGRNNLSLALIAVIVGGLLGLLLYGVVYKINNLDSHVTINLWHMVAYGPPVFILILSFIVTLHIGAARRGFSEHDREWLGRLGGFLLLYIVVWALVFTLLLYTTPFVQWLAGGGLAAITAWATASAAGAWLARSPETSGDRTKISWREIGAKLAPWLFMLGLVLIITYVTQRLIFKYFTESAQIVEIGTNFKIAASVTLEYLHRLHGAYTMLAMLVTGGFFVLICLLLDINLFSMHALYCNRLARAFLGATRAGKRTPNPFTGFDENDDLPLSDLDNQRPIPIINTAINMTGGDDLAWQTRRAASFALTPRWAGFETASTQGHRLGVYRPTRKYAGGKKLGTWVAVSGAAASPNMGYHTSPAVAALLTAFNFRLGRWCGNPKYHTWNKTSPGFAAAPIFAELSGSATAQAKWINLTDGGHFENLGVYELLRRRCRLIVVVDAGCDPQYQYEDLANLIRLAWTDLGVNVRFDVFEHMHLKQGARFLESHYALGRIQYAKDATEGEILYIKSSLTGNEWPDIRQYADMHHEFPHESTTDQFFDENQFEAYRHLGYKILATIIDDLAHKSHVALKNASRETLLTVIANELEKQKSKLENKIEG